MEEVAITHLTTPSTKSQCKQDEIEGTAHIRKIRKKKAKLLTKRANFTSEQLQMAAAREKLRTQERLRERKAKQCRAAISRKSHFFGMPKTPGNYNKMKSRLFTKTNVTADITRKKFDFTHMRASREIELRKYIAIPKSNEAKMSRKELREHLKKGAKELSKPALRKSTVSNNMILVRKFNELMDKLGEERAPTPHRALMFFTHLRNSGYSVSYISKSLTSLKYHPNLEEDYEDIATHPDVRIALANLRRNTLQSEDSRVPLTLQCMQQFEELIDKFTPKAALTMKTALWLGLTCMLRLGELCTTTNGESVDVHTLSFGNMIYDKNSVTLTFNGWKLLNHRRSIKFPFIEGTRVKMYTMLRDYTNYWKKTARSYVTSLIINEDGTAMSRQNFEKILHHLVDHSRWKGLNLTGHSMRIGGATIRHHDGMEIMEIMRLGRWQDNTIMRYLRPEGQQAPEILLQLGTYKTKRTEECHVLCNCPRSQEEDVQKIIGTKKMPGWNRKEWGSICTTQKATLARSRMHHHNNSLKSLSSKIPMEVKQVKKFVDGKIAAQPYVRGYVTDSKLVDKHFKGHELWFTCTVYVARKRWKRFLQACKFSATRTGQERRERGFQGVRLLSKATNYTMWELSTKDDKKKAKDLIADYDFYRKNVKNLPRELQEVWQKTKPTGYTKKAVLNHFNLRPEEVDAEVDYRNGNVQLAMEKNEGVVLLGAIYWWGRSLQVNWWHFLYHQRCRNNVHKR